MTHPLYTGRLFDVGELAPGDQQKEEYELALLPLDEAFEEMTYTISGQVNWDTQGGTEGKTPLSVRNRRKKGNQCRW